MQLTTPPLPSPPPHLFLAGDVLLRTRSWVREEGVPEPMERRRSACSFCGHNRILTMGDEEDARRPALDMNRQNSSSSLWPIIVVADPHPQDGENNHNISPTLLTVVNNRHQRPPSKVGPGREPLAWAQDTVPMRSSPTSLEYRAGASYSLVGSG